MNDKRLGPPEQMRIPHAAHSDRRDEPLPWHRPKSPEEDPDAPDRVRAIMASPGYRPAELDPAFIERDELRGVRLQLVPQVGTVVSRTQP